MEHRFDCMIEIEIRKCWNDDTLYQCLNLERFALEVAKSFFWTYSYWSPSEKCYENGRLNDTLKLIPNGDATLIFFSCNQISYSFKFIKSYMDEFYQEYYEYRLLGINKIFNDI